jgi:hypothetical protein
MIQILESQSDGLSARQRLDLPHCFEDFSRMRAGLRTSELIVVLTACHSLACAPPPTSGAWNQPWLMGEIAELRLGPAFRLTRVTPLDELMASPGRFVGQQVRTVGRIASTCNHAGCWIDLQPLELRAPGVLVTARDKSFSHPLDCVGLVAEVEGTLRSRTYPPDRLRHWAHHGWRHGVDVSSPTQVLLIEATTVNIRR